MEVTVRVTAGKGTLSAAVRDDEGGELSVHEVETDQSSVREALSGFDALVDAFPARGDAHGAPG